MAVILLVKHNCETCEYYADFEGVCCNGANSAWVGSWPPTPEKACKYWEDKARHYHPEDFFSAERMKTKPRFRDCGEQVIHTGDEIPVKLVKVKQQ